MKDIKRKEDKMRTMTIDTKAGQMKIEVSGTKQNPVAKFVGGMFDGLSAKPQHWSHKNLEAGIFVEGKRAYIQNAKANEELKNLISELPEEIKVIRKVKKLVDLDGDIVETEKYEGIGICEDEDGMLIPASEIEAMLTEKEIHEIEKNEAIKMWSEEKKQEYLEAQKKGESLVRAWNKASDGNDKI
jgi:hypothetical protein